MFQRTINMTHSPLTCWQQRLYVTVDMQAIDLHVNEKDGICQPTYDVAKKFREVEMGRPRLGCVSHDMHECMHINT